MARHTLFWILIIYIFHHIQSDEISLHTDETLILDAGNSSILVIHDAYVVSDEVNSSTCSSGREDIRALINKKCSGVSDCEIYLPTLQLACEGTVVVNYRRISTDLIYKFCNPSPISSLEGYIVSPGYPNYSPPLSMCNWPIQGRDGQTIELRVLDVSLSGCRNGGATLSIMEGNNRLYHDCDKRDPLRSFEVRGHALNVSYQSIIFAPHTGFLLYFRMKGCPTLSAPKNAFLVYRNGTALYRCNQGYLFNDTLQTSKVLGCIIDQGWNDTLSTCLSESELVETNHSLTEEHPELLNSNFSSVDESRMLKSAVTNAVFEDIIIPSTIIVSLLLINAIIIIIIVLIRRKQKNKQKALAKEEIMALKPCSGAPPTAV